MSKRSDLIKSRHSSSALIVLAEEMMVRHDRQLRNYSKVDRPNIGARIGKSLDSLLGLIHLAMKKYKKEATLRDTDAELSKLHSLIYVAYEQKALSSGQAVEWMELLDTAGKMLGGWIKQSKDN